MLIRNLRLKIGQKETFRKHGQAEIPETQKLQESRNLCKTKNTEAQAGGYVSYKKKRVLFFCFKSLFLMQDCFLFKIILPIYFSYPVIDTGMGGWFCCFHPSTLRCQSGSGSCPGLFV